MKRYYELTKEELIKLTSEQIQDLIDLEIAYEGITPIICPAEISLTEVDINKSIRVFQIGGIYFRNREDAEKVANMKRVIIDWNYNTGSNYKFAKDEDKEFSSVTEEYFYSESEINRVKVAIENNKALKEDYDAKKLEYDKYITNTSEIRSKVRDAVNEARQWFEDIEYAKMNYQKYLRLADGDVKIAKRFFNSAFSLSEEMKAEVFKKEVQEDIKVSDSNVNES